MASFYAKRANKVLRINDDAVERYLNQGYTITDMQGKVIRKGTPRDNIQLTAEYQKQSVEIETLKAKISSLNEALDKAKADNASLKSEVKSLKAELDKAKSETTEAKPTRKRKQTTTEAE